MSTASDPPGRVMRLTEELVRAVHREVPDEGPFAHLAHFTETDYDDHLAEFLGDRPDGPVQVFAYGSLIWKPAFKPAAVSWGRATGWSRAFCLRVARFRGTRSFPGLMMQIDRGDGCMGVLQTVDGQREWADLATLWRREMTVKPSGNAPQWIDVEQDGRITKAIAFTANRASPNYAGQLEAGLVASTLARACGHWGSGAEYLRQTVLSLESAGIHDPYLWQLQERVAELIEASGGG
jgi:cation transport protein ChaC